MKNITLIVLSIVGFLMVPQSSFAGNNRKQKLTDSISYEFTDDGVLRIEGVGELPDYKYSKGLLSKLKKGAAIRSIEIGEGITAIGRYTFEGDKYYNSNMPTIVSLPKSLKDIKSSAFLNAKISTVFHRGINFGPHSFSHTKWHLLELPAGSILDYSAFTNCEIDTLIISGGCILKSNVFANTQINHIIINTDDKIDFGDYFKYATINSIYVASDDCGNIKRLCSERSKDTKISTPESRARAKGVSSYLDWKLPSWEQYIYAQTSKLEANTPERAKELIERKIEAWQKKGEFESSEQWKRRVNENTRSAMVKKLTEEYNQTLTNTVETAKKEYAKMRKSTIQEYYSPIISQKEIAYRNTPMTLHPYDADNQTFMISSPILGDILLKVPIADATSFKNDWKIISEAADYEFAPISETEVGVSKIKFYGHYPKFYVYDGSSKANYAITEVNYNFSPLQITDGDLAQISIVDIQAPTAGTIVSTGGTIKKQSVDVNKRTISGGNGTGPQRTKNTLSTHKSGVDVNIPCGLHGSRENTFALVIANENYTRTSTVPYAIHDGEIIKQYLITTLGIPDGNIYYASDATLNDIRHYLKRLGDVCNALEGEADIIVYYAGHGIPDEHSHDAYLLPVDGYPDDVVSGMSLNEFTNKLASFPTRKATLLLDACFSGAGREGDMLTQARGVVIKPRPLDGKGSLVVFSAAQATETAHPYHDEGHGMFTYFLLKKLQETKGEVTLGDLSDYLNSNVKRTSAIKGKVQTPTVKASKENTSWTTSKL